MSLVVYKTNKVLSLSLMLMIHTTSLAQSSSQNYIQTKVYLDSSGVSFLRHIDYYDELGYVSETVDVGCNATQTPIVTRTDYTTQLKPLFQWAPVPSTGLDYIDDVYSAAYNYYGNWTTYSENGYDDFLELVSSTKPGESWEERPVTIARNVVPAGVVRKYSVDNNGNLVINDNSYYPYGMLTSTVTTDEDSLVMTVFTDYHGNTVLERRGEENDTYYVYDKYGRLGYVLPPMCQECSTSELPEYWYRYTYDDRGRCTEKQLPGCAAVKYWYDDANRIESEQDGHLRSQSLYRNYHYDAMGRLTLQTISTTRGQATENNAVEVEVKNYYDDYSFLPEFSQMYFVWAESINTTFNSPAVSKGLLTATRCHTSDGNSYFEIYRYDADGRIVYKLSAYSDKWMKVVHTSYNFIGDVVSMSENVYSHNNGAKYVLAKRTTVNAYHPGTRLLASTTITQTDKNGATSTQVVSSPSYDVFGNVIADNRPGTAADMTYAYDQLHGWLSSVSSPCGFSEQLLRETATNALFSGNIGSMLWRNSAVGEQHRYDYTYDSLGRLTDAHYSSSVNGTDGRYDESAAYNANGSVTWLLRGGMKNDGSFGAIDSLVVTYDGNRLLKVTDHAEALNYNGALDFHDGENTNCEYAYDSDGALTRDGNRGVSSITYDYDHHPYYIRMSDGKSYTRNDYTPGGCKLLSTHIAYIPKGNGSYSRKMTKNMYVDGLVLRGGKPLLWRFDGGYVELNDNGTPTGWNYYVTDHLGSTRMVVSSNDSIKETINYYPFGSEMRMQPPALLTEDTRHPFRFTGKELEKINSLNWYDFGARWYDVAGVPMWTSIDPLCEKYYSVSPYVYCHNNPVMLIDPDGMDDYYTEDGKFVKRDDNNTNYVFVEETQLMINGSPISSNDFQNKASTIYAESSIGYGIADSHEMYAIASVYLRNNKAFGQTSPLAKKFQSTALDEQTDGMQMANAALINALQGGHDYSNGATQWDGAEQAMVPSKYMDEPSNGRFMYKMNTMGWSMTDDNYSSWKNSIESKFGEGKFTVPQEKYATSNYGGMKNKGRIRLQSTAQYGLTIFWRETK